MRFAIAIPQFYADGEFDPVGFQAYMRRAEELGFESAWTQEQVLSRLPLLSPLEAMTYAAACTERIRLGCAVFIIPLHIPVNLAKHISSLDQMSRGRVDVGVGLGGRERPFAAFGIKPEGLVTRFTEGIRLMKTCWTESEILFEGRFWQVFGEAMEPKPFQKPYPPLWFGGSHPNALRRAVEHGNGFFGAGSQTTAQFADQVQVVRLALEESARSPETFRIAKRIYIAVDDDAERARTRITEALNRVYGRPGGSELTPAAVFGPPEECVRGVQAVADAGAELILFTPLFDQAEQMERLAAEVMPHIS